MCCRMDLRDGIQLARPGRHWYCNGRAGISHTVAHRHSSTLHSGKGLTTLWSRACERICTSIGCGIANQPNMLIAKSLQSCLTLCDPIDSSPPGFPIPGILQARTWEWVAISFSNA